MSIRVQKIRVPPWFLPSSLLAFFFSILATFFLHNSTMHHLLVARLTKPQDADVAVIRPHCTDIFIIYTRSGYNCGLLKYLVQAYYCGHTIPSGFPLENVQMQSKGNKLQRKSQRRLAFHTCFHTCLMNNIMQSGL